MQVNPEEQKGCQSGKKYIRKSFVRIPIRKVLSNLQIPGQSIVNPVVTNVKGKVKHLG
jgi:hypothetical protein